MAADLDKVISSLQQAVSSVHETNPDTIDYHIRLANAFAKRFEAQARVQDLQGAVSHFRSAALSPGGRPTARLSAARLWARYAEILDPRSELDAHEAAVELVSLLAGLDRGVEDRHSSLSRSSTRGTVRVAFAAALKHGETEKALGWLEQGRCLIWRQIHDLKTPIEDLESEHPELARQFSSLSAELEKLHGGRTLARSTKALDSTAGAENFARTSKVLEEGETHRRMKLVQDWESILQTIRSKHGFNAFLRPMPIPDTLRKIPRNGYTVVLNADDNRCDAVVISPGGGHPQSIPLPEFHAWQGEVTFRRLQGFLSKSGVRGSNLDPDVQQQQEDSREGELGGVDRAVGRYRAKSGEESIRWVLKELWERVVEPIVVHLQLKVSPPTRIRVELWRAHYYYLPLNSHRQPRLDGHASGGVSQARWRFFPYTQLVSIKTWRKGGWETHWSTTQSPHILRILRLLPNAPEIGPTTSRSRRAVEASSSLATRTHPAWPVFQGQEPKPWRSATLHNRVLVYAAPRRSFTSRTSPQPSKASKTTFYLPSSISSISRATQTKISILRCRVGSTSRTGS